MESVLITGGLGFIGIHTCLSLIEKDFNLYIIDSLINSSNNALNRLLIYGSKKRNSTRSQINFTKGDVRDLDCLRKIFDQSIADKQPIKYVIHFAGLKSVPESFKSPNLYWDVNVNGTIKLLNVMEEYDCRKIVFSSSATVYSYEEKSPLSEKSLVKPSNPYGKTKLAVEKIIREKSQLKDQLWNSISLRYFNPIGAHPSGIVGESPSNIPTNLFPYICQVAISKRKYLKIYGNDWPTQDGTCVRDFIHVMDLADGHLAALNYLKSFISKSSYKEINLGTGKGTSVLELLKIFEKVNNKKIEYIFSERRIGDKDIVYANCEQAKKILNWESKRDIAQMCKDGWNWQFKNPNGY